MRNDMRNDEELISAFIAGDASAMEVLFLRYRQSVFTWLVRMADCTDDAEDLYQTVWIKIIRNVGGFKHGSFKAWMWRIVHNTYVDYLRSRKVMLPLDEVESGAVLDCCIDYGAFDVSANLERSEVLAAVRAVIGRMPVLYRETILLRIDAELEFKEISDILKVPLGTVLARMHRAVQYLKNEFSKERLRNEKTDV